MPKDPYGHNRNTSAREGWNVTPTKKSPDPAKRGRVDLDPFKIDDHIKQQGTRIRVFRTLYCPNTKDVDSGIHNLNCTLCNGSGWLDVEPLCTVGMIQSQKLDKLIQIEGLIDGNLVAITLPIGVEITYFTLIELLDFTGVYIQRVLRKPGADVDILRYSACRVNVLADRDGTQYYQDADYKIDPNGDILWLSSAGAAKPADGVPYSIHYEAAIQFRAVRAMHVNRFGRHTVAGKDIEYIQFPQQWLAAREVLLKRRDQDGNELKQGPYDTHVIVP